MNKLATLRQILIRMRGCVLAYSGGLDSTFLLKVAQDALGRRLLAVTADSPTYQKEELDFSRAMARKLGARHRVIRTRECDDPRFLANPVRRCYYCKKELFAALRRIARSNGLAHVIDASTRSDLQDYRPGQKAKQELGVRSPLQEAGFTKQDVRAYSRQLGLSTWNKPSLACLASRVPYGTRIEPRVLRRIAKGERILRKRGFGQLRLRHHGAVCRIEVGREDFSRVMNDPRRIVADLKKIGYAYITLDLEGYRTGSMNEVIL